MRIKPHLSPALFRTGLRSLPGRSIFFLLWIFLFCHPLHAQNIYTFAGIGVWGYSGDGGQATAAELYDPEYLATDTAGNIYLADIDNVRIRKIDKTGIITTIAGNGYYPGGFTGDGGPATAAELQFPWGVAADAPGNVFIADCGNCRIRKVNTSGIINTVAGSGNFPGGYSGDGGPATAALLSSPTGVAVDLAGNLYIADEGNNRIRKVSTNGIITTVAGNGYNSGGSGGYSGDGGPATAAELWTPWGVSVDASGNIYIADKGNHAIRKVNTRGIISTIAGNGTLGYTGDGGQATAAEIGIPYGVISDPAGNIFIADWDMNVIREINTSGIINTFAGNGSWSYSGDGGPATAAGLENPTSVVFDCAGNTYITDNSNQRIREVLNGASPCLLIANFFTGDTTICAGDSVHFTDMSADYPTSWKWSFSGGSPAGSSSQNPIVYYGTAGTYSVKEVVKNKSGTDSLTRISLINVKPLPLATLHSNKDTLCYGDSAVITAGGGGSYLWKPGLQTSSTLTVKPTTTSSYTVVVSNGSCSDSAAITIVAPCKPTEPCGSVFVPNAFSPNGDKQNDVLFVHINPGCLNYLDFEVFDRWGNKVFETENINSGWDGLYKGKAMNAGTYGYYMHALMQDGTTVSKHGDITLVR